MELFVVRHAIAHERSAKRWPNDDLRPLTKQGIAKFTRAARGLKQLRVKPQRVLSSSLVRAQHTAKLLAAVAGWPKAQVTAALRPNATPRAVLADLRRHRVRRIAIVGHEPLLSKLIGTLISDAGARVVLKKGAVAWISFEGMPRPGRGTLCWLLAPRMLRKAGRR